MFPPADLDRRFIAYVIDRVLGWGIAAGAGYAAWQFTDGAGATVGTVAGAIVAIGLVNAILLGTTGLTPGKAAAGLRVVRRTTGRPIGFLAALGRALVLGVGGLPTAGLGVATLAWTAAADPGRQRRGLHDGIGDAVVVDVRPMPVVEDDDDQAPHQLVNLTAMRLLPVAPRESTPVPVPVPVDPAPRPTPGAGGAHRAAPADAANLVPFIPVPAASSASPPSPPSPPSQPRPPAGQVAPSAPAVVEPTPPASPAGSLPLQERTRTRPAAEPPSAPPGAPGAPLPAARWKVEFDSGETFVVEGLALVGRRPEPRPSEPVRHVVPLRSSDMSLSKTHAQFQVAPDGALVVMDRGSTNGSFVVRGGASRTLTPGRPSTLLPGDVVRFGDRTMTVERLS